MNISESKAVDISQLPDVDLSEAALLNAARANTGLDDFGDNADWREGFSLLVGCLRDEARLHKVGRLIAFSDVVRNLENRLRVTDDVKRHPEILEQRIVKPLFVVGLPRTGSTILHDIMSKDPANRVPMTWECHNMSPPPERATFDTDPRIAVCDENLNKTAFTFMPQFRAIHEMGALLAQECVILNCFDFKSISFAHMFRIPTYERWVESTDLTSLYRTHKRQLQYMQWRNPRERWVLKSVGHLWGLDAIYDVYPDAQVVMTHRDPVKLVASHCSLVSTALGMSSSIVDKKEVGACWSASWEDAMRRGVAFRKSGRQEAVTVFDMHFSELVADHLGVVQRIYNHFGLELTDVAKERMRDFIASNPKDRHGTHRYTIQEFGLDALRERERYRFYKDYFQVSEEH